MKKRAVIRPFALGRRIALTRTAVILACSCMLPVAVAFQDMGPPYMGQPPPGLTPVLFAPGVVNTEAVELNGVFTPDMREFFFARGIDGARPTMFHSQLTGGKWSPPRELMLYPGQARALAVDMAVSRDGNELFFLGDYRPPGANRPEGTDIWRSRRVNGAWATAEMVPAPISTDASEVYPTVVGDGSLYFTSNRPGGPGGSNVYRAQRLPNGDFAAPVLIPPPVNSEFGVGDPFVPFDERYMIFVSNRPTNRGRGDLYISFRLADGGWGEPVHLGDAANTDQTDFCPFVTPDGKYFFFSRRIFSKENVVTGGEVYWMDAKFLEQFKR
jgi:hypothetical protein